VIVHTNIEIIDNGPRVVCDAYLRTNHDLGDGRGYTLGTYLAYKLRGAAKNWAGRYKNALETTLERRVSAGLARKGLSRLGGTAYYPIVL